MHWLVLKCFQMLFNFDENMNNMHINKPQGNINQNNE